MIESRPQFLVASYLQAWLWQQKHDSRDAVILWLDHRKPHPLRRVDKIQIANALEHLMQSGVVSDYVIFPTSFTIQKSGRLLSLTTSESDNADEEILTSEAANDSNFHVSQVDLIFIGMIFAFFILLSLKPSLIQIFGYLVLMFIWRTNKLKDES